MLEEEFNNMDITVQCLMICLFYNFIFFVKYSLCLKLHGLAYFKRKSVELHL